MRVILCLLILWILTTNSLFSDSVKFKDGRILENVKITIKIDKIFIETEAGVKSAFSKKDTSSVRLKPVLAPS